MEEKKNKKQKTKIIDAEPLNEDRPVDISGKELCFYSPYIKNLNYKTKTHGAYITVDGKPKMIVIHYTASQTWDKTPEQQAAGILSWFEKCGLGSLVMATDGQIYKSYEHDLENVTMHTGKSYWEHAPGDKNIHWYGIGIEVCNAGLVGKTRNGYHPAWHYKEWNIKNELLKGKEPVQMNVREFVSHGKQKTGYYHLFSKEQEASLVNFCVWACQHWGIDPKNIVGHDEIDVSNKKSDPGGSLSMTMDQFRKTIVKKINSFHLN